MGEVKNPIRTIKIAAPVAIIFVTIVYFLVNIAYFSAVSKEDILNGGRIVAYVAPSAPSAPSWIASPIL